MYVGMYMHIYVIWLCRQPHSCNIFLLFINVLYIIYSNVMRVSLLHIATVSYLAVN